MVRSFKTLALLLVVAAVPRALKHPARQVDGLSNGPSPRWVRKLKLAAHTADESSAVAAFDEVSHEFDRLEGLMSTWRDVGGEILIGKRFSCTVSRFTASRTDRERAA